MRQHPPPELSALGTINRSIANFNGALFSDKGIFVDYEKVAQGIPFDAYGHSLPGFSMRRLRHNGDLITDKEKAVSHFMPRIDFDKELALFAIIEAGTIQPLHYHIGQETLYLFEGFAVEEVTRINLRPLIEVNVVPAFMGHSYRFPVPTFALFRFPILFLE